MALLYSDEAIGFIQSHFFNKISVHRFTLFVSLFGGLGAPHLAIDMGGCSFVAGFATEGLNVYRIGRKEEEKRASW